MKQSLILTVTTSLVLLGIASVDHAAETVTDANTPQTIQEYLRHAALNNAGLKAAFEEWKAALEAIPQAKALPDPRFTYGYFIEEVETRVGPQRQRFSLTQAFPWFGTIGARSDGAAAAAQAARKRYEAKKLRLFYDVKESFHEYVYLGAAIEIARDGLELVRRFEEVARAKYITAEAGHPDVIRAQMELAVLADKLTTLEQLRGPIVAQLNAVLNRPTGAALLWPRRERYHEVPVERDRIDFAVGIDWIDTDNAAMSGVRDSGKDPVLLMFSMNLPIWRKSYGAAELQARAGARRLFHQKTELANDLLARAERVLYDFEDSDRKIRLYGGVLVPQAEALVGASETAYATGTVDFLNLIDAEQTLLRFRLQHERVLANRQQRLAELEMLIGADLSDGQPSLQPD